MAIRDGAKTGIERVVLLVMDSVGIGELPDAAEYGDEGSNTIANTAKAVGGLRVPVFQRMGLGNIAAAAGFEVAGVPPTAEPEACFGRMAEASAGKDTTTGHWEISGIVLDRPFPTYPDGFPADLIARYEEAIGRKILGNKPASGTAIIDELGAEHMATGRPIVYTSADSVFQVAAHEEVIPVEELYRICRIAREMLTGEHAVGRVIARPFVGRPGSFKRTERRRDFSLEPQGTTILDALTSAGIQVMAVGKIDDIFAGRGISKSKHVVGNDATCDGVLEFLRDGTKGLIFANAIDFDMVYGHRNDVEGYAKALERLDERLEEIMGVLTDRDILMVTADHGCDPTTPSTDHSREHVPLLVWGRAINAGVDLGTRRTFSDIAATLADIFGLMEFKSPGTSFAKLLGV